MTPDEWKSRERRLLYGRRQGHKLKGRQAALMESLLPEVQVLPNDPRLQCPGELFNPDVDRVWLEIGFGGGEHLAAQALANNNTGIIGAEPFVNGVAKLLCAIDEHDLQNVKVFPSDAREILDGIGDKTIGRAFLLYPDPWPKARHNKRRFVGIDNLNRLHRVLKKDGVFCFASDIPDYVRWTLREVYAHGGFEWVARRPRDWRTPPENWPGTRYEAKALLEARVPVYLNFRKI